MNATNHLFSNGNLDETLRHKLGQIRNAVARWNEDRLLSLPDTDVIDLLVKEFSIKAPVLDRGAITVDPVEEGYTTVSQFGETAQIRQTVVAFSVPYTGERNAFMLRPNTWASVFPTATVTGADLKIYWEGQGRDAAAIKQALNTKLNEIEKWLGWASAQISAYNQQAASFIEQEVQSRKSMILANRNLEAEIGFPIRRRSDAATYAVPVKRKTVDLRPHPETSTTVPFRPEPALADAHYEEAIRILLNSRNQLERSPSTTSHLGEEAIRDNLLLNLNGQLEGKAAGEVFNGRGKTDILIRVDDRHVFIGECKFWKGPKTITDTLDQLLGYLVWRDTKAALLLFIRSGTPSDIIPKALEKCREHPNFKREGTHASEFGERYNLIFHANGDKSREIKLAFLPFNLLPS
ncbi:hypothetical protein AB0P36_33800 [Streptomyces flavidovirens]|uniref:hypothetical protein n=1 Tax=Streptomyces flavidovirens TaxID=67298 RepID=UPI0034408FFA